MQKIKERICPKCLELIPPQSPFEKGGSHDGCCGTLPFDQVWSLGYYHDPKLRTAITALKFNGTSVLKEDLRKFVSDQIPELPEDAILIPMPLAEKRLKERGFNQAELIAGLLPLKSSDCLIRVIHRDPQSSMDHNLTAREANIKNCFKVNGNVPKKVILVDDVITTGATAAEAAKILLNAGAESVSIFTLAIGA